MSNYNNPGNNSKIPLDVSTEIFIKNWTIYKKIIENDNMSHKAGYSKLKEILLNETNRPFTFLDLACGDAYYSSITLENTKAAEYIGIDVSAKALSFAEQNIKKNGIRYSLIEADFVDFNKFIEKKPDVIWIGFSLHHLETPDKLAFFKKVKTNLSKNGMFMIYEPIFLEGENLQGYHKRFRKTYDKYWRGLDKEEEEILFKHMRESERPETTEGWINIGKEAGFKNSGKILSERTGLYEIYKFR